jgi:hypothetical protein
MKTALKEQFPEWTMTDLKLENDLIVGDDSDSVLACNLLEEFTNGKWNMNYFYNFENFYRHEKTGLQTIGVDMAFTKNIKCFDNHITKQYLNSPANPYMANLNLIYNITAANNYYKKYPFSTLMLIMAMYDIPLPKSDIGKDIILSVDSSFKGHYTSKKHFKDIHTGWLERLGFTELIDRLDKNNSAYYYKVQDYLKLNEKVTMNEDGYVESEIDFEKIQPYLDWKVGLSDKQFHLIKECEGTGQEIYRKLPERSELISLAYTGKDYVCFTKQKEVSQ